MIQNNTVKTNKAAVSPGASLTGCTISSNTAANKHTRAAVMALAQAAEANARAIEAASKALQGGNPIGVLIEAPRS